MDERNFFDRLSENLDAREHISTPDKVREILAYMDIKPGARVLDLGTGTGVLLPEIARLVGPDGSITAVDYSTGMLEKAIAKNSALTPEPRFMQLDFETETVDGIYDNIILYCVYPHLHTPGDTIKWLRAVNLADGGTITVAFPTDERFINNVHRERHSDSDFLPPAAALAEIMRDNGLDATAVVTDSTGYVINISKKEI